MADIYGPNSFNGLVLLAGAACARILGAALVLALGLAWVARRTHSRARRMRIAFRATLANALAAGLLYLAMEYLGFFGPAVPAWVDLLGFAWPVAFIGLCAMMLLRPVHRSLQDTAA